MKLYKKRGVSTSIRTVMTDDKKRVLCVVGKISDLLVAGILEWSDYDGSLWLSISNYRPIADHLGHSCKEALELFAAAGF